MAIANLVVGDVTPLLREEIEGGLAGSVRQICASPALFLVQIPYRDGAATEGTGDVEIGTGDGQGYLLIRSAGWRCAYLQHPSDIAQTALRSLKEGAFGGERALGRAADRHRGGEEGAGMAGGAFRIVGRWDEEDGLSSFELSIIAQIRQEELSAYDRYIWSVAQDPATLTGRPDLRAAFQALITMSSYSSPAIREAVAAAQEELAALDEEAANGRIIDIVNEFLVEAEALVGTLSEEDHQVLKGVEMAHLLQALRANMLTESEVAGAIGDFGELEYREARPDVERCLTHPLPEIRRRALETLIMYWGLFEYTGVAFLFLRDPDPDCRQQGMRCLNPEGKMLQDLDVLSAYARVCANGGEAPRLRLCAYGELLTASGIQVGEDDWGEIERFVEGGGALEQAPHVDWQLVQFFLEEADESCTLHFSLSYETYGGDWPEWEDQHGRVFNTVEELAGGVLLSAHHIARTRLPRYQMAIAVSQWKGE